MVPEPRPELRELVPAVHGGNAGAGIIDFSTGISPLPPPETIVAAARNADLTRYPHPTALPFRMAVAALHGLPPEQIVAGAGSVELIWALTRVFAGSGRTGVVVTPAFGEYEQALRASGASVVTVAMAAPQFELSTAELGAALTAHQHVSLAFICRPSNPCLTATPPGDILDLARRWPGTLFVVDEAYQPMFEDLTGLAPGPNVAVLRSMTKVFALPGLRLGYLLASREVASATQAALPPWNVSSPAQAAGVVASELLPSYGPNVRDRIASLRRATEHELSSVAGVADKSGGPFLLYKVGDAAQLTQRLFEQGIRVRHCASFGLPEHVRLGVRLEQDRQALLGAWRTHRA